MSRQLRLQAQVTLLGSLVRPWRQSRSSVNQSVAQDECSSFLRAGRSFK